MASQKTLFPFAVYVIPVKGENILVSRRYNTGYMDGNYSLVAGHVDGNETATAAAIREAREEAGIEINPEDLTMIHTLHRKSDDGKEYIDLFYICNNWQGEPEIMEPHKCDDMLWTRADTLPENTLEYIRHVFDQCKAGSTYSEFGWDN